MNPVFLEMNDKYSRDFHNYLGGIDNYDKEATNCGDWKEANPEYKKDKLFQAWLWLSTPMLIARYENSYLGYNSFFNTLPTKKAIMEVISYNM